jgi:hypothetical protein
MSIVWIKNKQFRKKAGDCSYRTFGRLRAKGLIPEPEHPFGNNVDYWREDIVDATVLALAAAAKEEAAAEKPATPPTKRVSNNPHQPKLRGRFAKADDAARAEQEVDPPRRKRGRPRNEDRAKAEVHEGA